MFKTRVPLSRRVKEALHPTPLRQRISEALHQLKMQLRKLDNMSYRMQERDSALQAKCVSALQSKNVATARIYATECAEIRKIAKIVLQSQLALEQVALRLETLKEFGDIVHVMGPVISIVGTVKSQLRAILPEISAELGQVNESLEYLVLEIGEATDQTFDVSASSEEAQRILQEASTVAEQKMKERFPELPSVPSPEARAG